MKSLFEKISQSSDDLRTCRVKNSVDMFKCQSIIYNEKEINTSCVCQ